MPYNHHHASINLQTKRYLISCKLSHWHHFLRGWNNSQVVVLKCFRQAYVIRNDLKYTSRHLICQKTFTVREGKWTHITKVWINRTIKKELHNVFWYIWFRKKNSPNFRKWPRYCIWKTRKVQHGRQFVWTYALEMA